MKREKERERPLPILSQRAGAGGEGVRERFLRCSSGSRRPPLLPSGARRAQIAVGGSGALAIAAPALAERNPGSRTRVSEPGLLARLSGRTAQGQL